MPSSVSFNSATDCVEVVHCGVLAFTELEESRRQVAALLLDRSASRILVDGRESDIATLSIADAYEFHSTHDITLPGVRRLRIAVVVAPQHLEQSFFAETVARNRGIELRLLLSVDDACNWLADGKGIDGSAPYATGG